ncbi:MAG: DNA-directed RNA polymerase subunit alpha [Candidatus Vogelbacteria bacterium CG10_big_fil_rev_8_21_14_0_10_51_16]|uniref:DNA-directed RNA polymerase subunit alpha n=1 Tax=Candidatus Vogelbacteria bacterium CG10_big_fil_rev_8_21_14_0_10_51_16 TaxID=1975045 RepID=A0A2H0REB5_9BACT|nr:MAG: DNA-directed RNA polymerase subunit alpha [Candidatus Vogelbacteria bacterium CG10_big_fil_rev_8_21_14_0_10_51_16]
MTDQNIILPSKPKIISEDEFKGVYEIDGLYPGYGHTLGNSLRRVILSSLPGSAITAISIKGVAHEFSTLEGIKEDVISILLNLKRARFKMSTEEPQKIFLDVKGAKEIKAGDLKLPGQVELCNPDEHICTITDKSVALSAELTVESGIGYVSKEMLHREKVEVGTIVLDAIFSPIRRVNYEVDHMRVGNRTDYNRLRIFIETDGVISPREALERSIVVMIHQLSAIVGFQQPAEVEQTISDEEATELKKESEPAKQETEEDVLKTRIEDVSLSARTMHALTQASIRTIGGLARKREEDLLEIAGLGEKGISEIKRALSNFGIVLK